MNEFAAGIEAKIETYKDRGVIRLKELIPAAKVKAAVDAARVRMEAAGIWKGGSWHVDHLRQAPINEGAKFGRKLKGAPEFDELVKGEIPNVVARLLDDRSTFCGMAVPQPLFTLPNADTWNVPHNVWHLDVPRLPDGGIPGVQIFTFLESVAPTGGGTLVVAGSHRLLNGSERISSKNVKRRLKDEPYFRDLMSADTPNRQRFIDEVGHCGDVELQVVEMHGEPGDVYFVDLRVLHTPAPNATPVPRIMLTRRFFLESQRKAIYSDGKPSEMS